MISVREISPLNFYVLKVGDVTPLVLKTTLVLPTSVAVLSGEPVN